MKTIFGAVDVGASSGRVLSGEFHDGKLSVTEVYRFENGPVEVAGSWYWDFDRIMSGISAGLRELGARAERLGLDVRSIGIDTWAVDYGLIADGELLAQPNCYRDPANEIGVQKVHDVVPFDELYQISGLQFLPFNSLYQLRRQLETQSNILGRADNILLMPDLIAFWLTGKLITERTNASSTGLLDATTREWNKNLAEKLSMPIEKFPPLTDAGQTIGKLARNFGPRLAETQVVTVGSHDTASAVVGVPSEDNEVFYLSSGTWSLLGTELTEPLLSKESMTANFTNELGVDGRVRYLKNLSGLWLLSESQRDWEERGEGVTLGEVLQAAESADFAHFDVSDPSLVAPGNMPARIKALIEQGGQMPPESKAGLVASILHSLAMSYAENLKVLEELTGRDCKTLHVIGGGSQNALLNQLTANYCKVDVVAGPAEATAIGNLMVQVRAAELIGDSLEEIRSTIIRSGLGLKTYSPESN
jgi:rhamnulokinase